MISATAAALGLLLPKSEEQGAGGDGTVRVVVPVPSGRSAPASRAVNRLDLWGSAHPRARRDAVVDSEISPLWTLANAAAAVCRVTAHLAQRQSRGTAVLDGRSAPAGSPRRVRVRSARVCEAAARQRVRRVGEPGRCVTSKRKFSISSSRRTNILSTIFSCLFVLSHVVAWLSVSRSK
jgi:hypothetical protein